VWNIFYHNITVGGYKQGTVDRVWVVLPEPGEVKIDGVVRNSCILVTHLFDDIVDDRSLHQNDGAFFDLACKAAARTKIDK
jgi:hypothetical protein